MRSDFIVHPYDEKLFKKSLQNYFAFHFLEGVFSKIRESKFRLWFLNYQGGNV